MPSKIIAVLCLLCFLPNNAYAASFDATTLSLGWGTPFIGILLSIALLPLLLPTIWHNHYGKITAVWTLLFIIPFATAFGISSTTTLVAHAIFEEYIPFILLLLALFTVSGGIFIQGNFEGTPKFNVLLLITGTLLASVMGTTGAAMLMIRPIIRANSNRPNKVHVIIFFIFLVANVGGGLTPLGDPPLFIGFLKGVNFFWTLSHMLLPVLLTTFLLLIIFYYIDSYYYKRQAKITHQHVTLAHTIKIYGKQNISLLVAIISTVLLSGIWQSDINLMLLDTNLALQNIIRDLLFIIITIISVAITPKHVRLANQFNWQPIIEVAKLFIAIFITIVPVLAILRAGNDGHLSSIVSLVTNDKGEPINTMYFWLSGVLSGFLDNAPTYLVFFNLASGDANILMGELHTTLLAISMGSVFMGALTYIGNAPNFMVRSIAIQNDINMPSFFGYMKWSISILIPVFLINTLIFFIL
ncbi:sodium:proton antiporter [Orbus sturtevantii]|uniref:sodium:proton antiporter n=1 Tax=Orbus sturtevantii TaxID=3074109 RepID=UPI00370CFE8F